MTKVINLQDYQGKAKYADIIKETHVFLDETQEKMDGLMINLSAQGVWKETFDKYKEGETFTFTQDMLENTGDNNIELLWELYFKIDFLRNNLKDYLVRIRK
jgi:uncharacterized protein YyaL (SSP411 family)